MALLRVCRALHSILARLFTSGKLGTLLDSGKKKKKKLDNSVIEGEVQ